MSNIVRLVSSSAHTSIIITGFLMLRKQKKIDFDFQEDYVTDFSSFPTNHIVEAVINGKRISFDTYDGSDNLKSETAEKYIKNIDAYFKRSYLSREIEKLGENFKAKIHPLGLFYRVTFPGNPLDREEKQSLKGFLTGHKTKKYFTPKRFECENFNFHSPQVLFFTRVWGDADHPDEASEQEINQTRMQTVRLLRHELKDQFLGGIQDSPLAGKLCPDLILPGKYTRRDLYLKQLHKCSIAVSSEGLRHSINGKIAETVASGRALVCEKLYFELPRYGGGFLEGKNYLSFSTPEECVEKVLSLLHDPGALQEMQQNNRQYYNEFARPDKMVYWALKTAGAV